MNRKKIERKLLFSVIIFSMLFLNSNLTIPFVKSVDINYSTYLYNQNINLDNDKAHLFQESAEGSNSYRNTFESNFLFPSKINTDMLSTTATTEYSHYQFNQYYLDNLDNDYAYSNYNNTEIENQNVNDYNVNIGNSIDNGLGNTENINDYNTTYSFDNYQETASNYGNYNGTYSFYNEIGLTNTNIGFVDVIDTYVSCGVLSEFNEHKSVLSVSTTDTWDHIYNNFYSTYGYQYDLDFSFWMSASNSAKRSYFRVLKANGNILCEVGILYDQFFYRINDTDSRVMFGSTNDNQWNYFYVSIYDNGTNYVFDVAVNGVNYYSEILCFTYDYPENYDISKFCIGVQDNTYNLYLDGIHLSCDSNYRQYDNCNPYGIQNEIENDNFNFEYRYGLDYYIKDNNDYRNNVLVLNKKLDCQLTNYPYFVNSFSQKTYGSFEISFLSNNTAKQSTFGLRDNSNRFLFTFGFVSNKFQYYDSGWNEINGITPMNNIWYHVLIDFSTINDKWNLTINGVNYLQNQDLRLDYSIDWTEASSLQYLFYTNSAFFNLIDNLDFSWTCGYYPYRSYFPNGNLYISDSNGGVDYITPSNDYYIESSEYTSLPHFNRLNDYPNYYDYDYIDYVLPSKVNIFELSNISEISKTYTTIEVFIYGYLTTSCLDDMYIQFLDIDDNPITSSEIIHFDEVVFNVNNANNPVSSDWDLANYEFTSLSLSYQNVNEMKLMLTTPSFIWSYQHCRIESIFLKCSYEGNCIDIEYEKEIEYEYENPYALTLKYVLGTNTSQNIQSYIYNYDLQQYHLINDLYYSNNYEIYSFYLNESGYFRNELINIRFVGLNSSNEFLICIDYLNISILYGFENNEGYQYLQSYNYRYDSNNLLIGYFLFELKIYNNFILYRYSEINYYADNYIYAWFNYSIQSLNLENIEIQIHSRYGLNTLDIEILNYYVIIWFNYESYIEFYEQSRKDLTGCKLKSSFNYTANNFNFLNRTGIIGNYSYNCLKGCRSLYGNMEETFHRYFTIPYFSQDIEVNIDFSTPDESYSNPDEPNLPSSYYWTYETYRVVYGNTVNIPIGNWTIEFKTMKAEIYTAKHPYEPQTLDKDDYPSFKFKFKFPEVLDDFSFTIDLNFIRNFFVSVINLILLFIQWIGFMIISSLSYIAMFIGCSILVFIWNTLVYYIFIGLMYILWYLFEGLYLLIAGLVWFYEYVILPFLRWCKDYLLPIIIEFAIYWISYFLAWMIYLITLGQVDRITIQTLIYDLLWFLVIEIYNWIITFANNIYYILLFVVWYILCVLYLYLRYLLARSRGFKSNAERYYYTLTFFLIPIRIVIDWIKELLGITPYL